MSVVVQKYGGTSVADSARIQNVARRVAVRRNAGGQLVVVVSAMGDTTDRLLALARDITEHPEARELDLLLSTGETQSMTLVAMALHALDLDAVSLSGAQAGLRTDKVHGKARILSVDPGRIHREIERGRVVIVSGFQGITEEEEVTTLGRGASDLTAVALAASLEAERCEIYTDVDGVYSADPRIAPEARKLKEISYEEMLEFASLGARVMNPRAVELGAVYDIPIVVASSFKDEAGTIIHGGADMEQGNRVRGIAHDLDVAKVTIRRVPDKPGIAAKVFETLADQNISVDTIVQNASIDKSTDLTFTVHVNDLPNASRVVDQLSKEIGAGEIVADDSLGKVSLVGTGIHSAPGYAARMFRTLSDDGVNIEMISTGEIRITVIIKRSDVDHAVRALHKAFELEKPDASEL
jgi:aspartate kinase